MFISKRTRMEYISEFGDTVDKFCNGEGRRENNKQLSYLRQRKA